MVSPASLSATGSGVNAKNVHYSIAASCNTHTVTLKYKFDGDNRSGKRLIFSEAEFSNSEGSVPKNISIGELPSEINEIRHPYVVKVVPICIEQSDLSFIFYIGSESSLDIRQRSSQGAIYLLHLEFSSSAKLNKYISST